MLNFLICPTIAGGYTSPLSFSSTKLHSLLSNHYTIPQSSCQ